MKTDQHARAWSYHRIDDEGQSETLPLDLPLLALNGHVKHIESVPDQVEFDTFVQWTVRSKAR